MVSSFGKVTKKRYNPAMKFKYDFGADSAGPALPVLAESLDRLDAVANGLDAVVLTSKDSFISEYVPKENSLRFGATRFTGSVGDAVYFTESFRSRNANLKPLMLFVDGRYHLQADQEADSSLVSVVKLDVEPNIESGVQRALSAFSGIKIGMDFERASVAGLASYRRSTASHGASLHHLDGAALLQALGLPGWTVTRPVFSISKAATGRTLASNLEALARAMKDASGNDRNLHVTATADDAAFLLNARAFHTPNHASILAYTFFAGRELALFFPACSKDSPVELDPSQTGNFRVTVIRDSIPELKTWIKNQAVTQVFFNASAMNAFLPEMVKELHPEAAVREDFNWVLKTRARKTPEEMDSIRSAFLRSSRAIAATLRWGKAESLKRKLSEWELADHLSDAYVAEGATSLSFSTISGAGANSAIVHYSKPSKTEFF
ncbi:MAG: M24 family metallopeptidase, partial [Proteobacteria bacterium]|nr:M24 family metallopeptidase [Pseudomonadota bacterium]